MVAKLAKKGTVSFKSHGCLHALIIEGLELGELDDDVLAAAAASRRTDMRSSER